MTKARVVGVIVVLLFAMSQGAFAEGVVNTQPNLFMTQGVSLVPDDFQSDKGVRIIIDLLPASFLSSPNIDGFKVTRTDRSGGGWYSYTETETQTIDGTGSWIPSLRGGVSFDVGPAYVEPTIGAGYLINGAFTSPMLMGDVACRFKLGDVITLGPHIGLVRFGDPSWNDWSTDDDSDEIDDSAPDVDIDVSSTTGYMAGVAFTAGGETVAFSCSLDYIAAKFDVENGRYWTANSDKLDISGWALTLGVAFRF
jgi:hypothetical protein